MALLLLTLAEPDRAFFVESVYEDSPKIFRALGVQQVRYFYFSVANGPMPYAHEWVFHTPDTACMAGKRKDRGWGNSKADHHVAATVNAWRHGYPEWGSNQT